MKKLNITWDGITDPTGYLFSFAKSLSCAVKNSPWAEYSEDIIATSGFAFRMWVSADLCPSATSIWTFSLQPYWVGNGGFNCDYTERLWGQDDIKEQKRLEAVEIIKKSIDKGIPAVSWDIGVPEWGLITGYDDDAQNFATLAVSGEGEMLYDLLGVRDLPLLSVLTITGKTDKKQPDILRDTIKLAATHLSGGEWTDNAKGIQAYPALIRHFEGEFNPNISWNMEYFLGTYGALKYYAWKYFEKYGQTKLSGLYKEVYDNWLEAFKIKTGEDISKAEVRSKIAALLKNAEEKEKQALIIMSAK
ncbi:hypothetical protein FACS1894219_02210 [Clostridia bacterium]|nr:hypothetical protein FACS1894219_02210 [Clostridia bacterium]